jgi:hypothetical protein
MLIPGYYPKENYPMKKVFLLLTCVLLVGGMTACAPAPKVVPITKAEATNVLVKVGQVLNPGDRSKLECLNGMGFVDTAWEQHKIEKSASMTKAVKLPKDYAQLMKVLVPKYLDAPVKCPSGGSYSIKFIENTADSSGKYIDYSVSIDCSVHGSLAEFFATQDGNVTQPSADSHAAELVGTLVTPEFKANTDALSKKQNDAEKAADSNAPTHADDISAYEMLDSIAQNVYDKEVMANISSVEMSGNSISFSTKVDINTGTDTVNFKKVGDRWLIDSVSMAQTQLVDPNAASGS